MVPLNCVPRPEYPRPQLVRDKWLNINGWWEFEIDHGRSGKERQFFDREELSGKILVPFCPESKLSGVGYRDFMAVVWYRREFDLPAGWERGNRILLHFEAVDYSTEVWVNGVSVGTHRGGYTPFTFDITEQLSSTTNVITVCAQDDGRSGLQPRGKQSHSFYSRGCDYTRVTGIWQTVWLECVPVGYIQSLSYIPDPDNAVMHVQAQLAGEVENCAIVLRPSYKGKPMGEVRAQISGKHAQVALPLAEVHLWEPGCPRLYDLDVLLINESGILDQVQSYFGMRTVTLGGQAVLINGKPVFQRLVLDQGYYPEGVYTAPSDDDLRKDIELSLGLGFNGARLHQKVFERRFLYWADKLGYLVWGEYPSWGLDITTAVGLERFLPEWMEAVRRDFNHPALIIWCPFNETWDNNGTRQNNEVLRIVYEVTKQLDPTRPVIDTSGNYHVVTDIFDVHDYDQNVETFTARYQPMASGGDVFVSFPDRQKYEGQPYFVSEYGGIWWNDEDEGGWGYGRRPTSREEFMVRYRGLTEVLLSNPRIAGFCYTQLYDVEQEVNGLYTYERQPKFNPSAIRQINEKKAAIEE
ncbi:MAG: glycoside hydrolase family 2 protein [Limnochordia bacterium]|jgi:beta-galactosidase/beta-glucuronidase